MDLGLGDLRVLVTGGSAGIGLATAELLSAEGARVAICARNTGEQAARLGATGIDTDLSTAEGCRRAVETAAEALGGLDGLVNNVGLARIGSFSDIDDERWQAAWDLNVMSYVRCIRAALPLLRDSQHAAIVNVSSTSGKRPSAGMPEYSVTKAAVLSLSRLVADISRRRRHPLQRRDAGADAVTGLAGYRRPGRPDRRGLRPKPRGRAEGGRRRPPAGPDGGARRDRGRDRLPAARHGPPT